MTVCQLSASTPSAPTDSPAKRRHLNEMSAKRNCAGAHTDGPTTSRGDWLVARQRTHLAQEDYNRLYPLEIEGYVLANDGSMDKRPRSKAARRKSGRRDEPTVNDPDQPPIKKQRTKCGSQHNWSTDSQMIQAVEQWLDGPVLDPAGMKLSAAKFADMNGIPATTFKYYVHKDPAKRRKLGHKIGRKSLISDEASNVLCEVVIRHD